MTGIIYVFTFIAVKITFDPPKCLKTLSERGIDFAVDAEKVFAGKAIRFVSSRWDYGEKREVTIGWLGSRMVVVVWTQRGTSFR